MVMISSIPLTLALTGVAISGMGGDLVANTLLDRVCSVQYDAPVALVYDHKGKLVDTVAVPGNIRKHSWAQMNLAGELIESSKITDEALFVAKDAPKPLEGHFRLTFGPRSLEKSYIVPGWPDEVFASSPSGDKMFATTKYGSLRVVSWPAGADQILRPFILQSRRAVYLHEIAMLANGNLCAIASITPRTVLPGIPIIGESGSLPDFFLDIPYYLVLVDTKMGVAQPVAGFVGIDQRSYNRPLRQLVAFNGHKSVAVHHADKLYMFSLRAR